MGVGDLMRILCGRFWLGGEWNRRFLFFLGLLLFLAEARELLIKMENQNGGVFVCCFCVFYGGVGGSVKYKSINLILT